jgi:hypothetical protein
MTVYHLNEKAGTNSWPDPLELLDIMDAVDAKKTRVYLNGRAFNIKYKEDRAFVQLAGSYAPCGWFSEDDFRVFRKGS